MATRFHFGEWLEPDSPPNPVPSRDHGIVATAYLFRSATLFARAAAVPGEPDVAAHYPALAANVGAAWGWEYLDRSGRVSEESQGHYVRALAFGFASTGAPSWLAMLDAGATAMREWWDGVTGSGVRGSLNHCSKGAVGSFLYTHVAGIRLPDSPDPDHPGYGAVTIAPRPGGGITSASAAVGTPHGRITTAWNVTNGIFSLDVALPRDVRATLELPDGSTRVLSHGSHHLTALHPNGLVNGHQHP